MKHLKGYRHLMSETKIFYLNIGKSLFFFCVCVFFSCKGGQTLEYVAQGVCAFSILGDTQKPTEHCLGNWLQVAPLEQGIGQDDLQGSTPTSIILCCCET